MKLSEIPVTEIMSRNVITVSPSQRLIDVKHIFERREFHHHIPVAVNGKIKGIISLIDFLYAIKNASLDDDEKVYHRLLVKNIMKEHPFTRPSSTSIKEIAQILSEGNVHAVVICDNEAVKGIVSTADVIKYFLKTVDDRNIIISNLNKSENNRIEEDNREAAE